MGDFFSVSESIGTPLRILGSELFDKQRRITIVQSPYIERLRSDSISLTTPLLQLLILSDQQVWAAVI